MPPEKEKTSKLRTSSFDLIVIGSGPGGQRAALQAAKIGKKVAIVEDGTAVGGGCVQVGTLPSKSFRESVYRWSLGSRGTLGMEREHSQPVKSADLPDMSRLLKRKDRVVSEEARVISDQLNRNKISVIHGRARITSSESVDVYPLSAKKNEKAVVPSQTLKAPFIVIATGARPVSPAHLEHDGKFVHNSNTILSMKKVPKSIVVLGGGIIGCEYASMFSMAGSKVYLVDRRHEILAAVDREIVAQLVARFEAEGMEVVLQAEATEIERSASEGCVVHLSNGREIECDVVLVAQGRSGNIQELGLDAVGIDHDDRGLIKVDKFFRTSVSNIYAVGDVIGAPALASTSMEQGRLASCNAFQLESHEMGELYPYGIYTIPEISMIGPTEEDLTARKVDFVVGRARYRELARGQIVGDSWGLLKLIVDRKTLKLLAIHIVGDSAADLIHIGQAVMAFNGDVNYFIRSVFNYPTLAEAYKTAAFHAVNVIQGRTSTR